jgi:Fe-S cluster biogenesis protein NfuA
MIRDKVPLVIEPELYYIDNGTVEKGSPKKNNLFDEAVTMSLNRKEIDEIVNTRIASILRVDGGSIEVTALNEDSRVLTVRFGGTYRGSPCRGIVLRYIVLPILKQSFGELDSLEMAD